MNTPKQSEQYCQLLAGLLILGFASAGHGQMDYFPDFEVTDQPVRMETSACLNGVRSAKAIPDGSGRMLAARSFNRIYTIQPDGSSSVFHDIPDIHAPNGFNSLEFHPDFATPGAQGFGKYYTVSSDAQMLQPADFVSGNTENEHKVVTEWTTNDITANAFSGTRREIARFATVGSSHSIDDLEFGNDGMLYIATGDDEFPGETSQDPQSVYGKILRIDPFGNNSANGNYGIPADNPFSNEVYATGFRNPWRLSIDSETGEIHAADVGFNSIEEVDLVTSGANYGYPFKEGSFIRDDVATPDLPDPDTNLTLAEELGLTDPIYEFDHTDGLAIIGGFVYRGSQLPWLDGKYIFGSFPEGDIYFGDPDTGEIKLLFPKGEVRAFSGGAAITIEEDPHGEIMLWGTQCATLIQAPEITGAGDYNNDGLYDCADIDPLVAEIVAGTNDTTYDLNGDGTVDQDDLTDWLAEAGNVQLGDGISYILGDANLDGGVDVSDFNAWNEHKFGPGEGWCSGDFNADGFVDVSDFNIWNSNKFQIANAPVPEPSGLALLLAGVVLLTRRFR